MHHQLKVFLLIYLSIAGFCYSEAIFSVDHVMERALIAIDDQLREKDVMHLQLKSSVPKSKSYDDAACLIQLNASLNALLNFDWWAIQAFDSWGKIPSGFLVGNIIELGSFDECVNIYRETDDVGIIKGQYCLAVLDILDYLPQKSFNFSHKHTIKQTVNQRVVDSNTNQIGTNIGMCFPNTCSPEFLTDFIKNITETPIVQLLDDFCQEKKEVIFSSMDIFAICVFTIIATLMLGSTIYDVIMTAHGKERKQALLAFSVYANGEKIFRCSASKSKDVIDCLNGIRVLSIIWIVYGHSYLARALRPNINLFELFEWTEKFHSTFILGGTVSVDTFLLLSGFLVTWSTLRHLDKNHGRLNILMMYFHRYIRLTPALAASILFYSTIAKHLVDGPLQTNLATGGECKNYWWSALLYVQNYVNNDEVCLGHSWYLSVDMQLFVLSPIVVYPLWRWRNKFLWVIPLLIILSMACTFTIFMLSDFKVGLFEENQAQEKTYFATHTRMGVYLVGILLAYLLHNLKEKEVKLPMLVIVGGWAISFGMIAAIVFGIYPFYQPTYNKTVLESAFYEPGSRVGWGIALSWIIFACVHGYGGPINWFLSWRQWQPLARLSYSIYLVHFMIQMMFLASVKTSSFFSDAEVIHGFWGDFGFSICSALILTLAFESPVLILEKMLFQRSPRATSNSKENLLETNKEDA